MTHTTIKTLRLITTRSIACPTEFSLAHRRVYSLLAFRSRLDLGASQREIARDAITDARTTKHVLAFLEERKLVEHRNGMWHALEPTEENRTWFAENKSAQYDEHWSDRFSYSTLLVPAKGALIKPGSSKKFTINHAHVYSLLDSLGRSNKQQPGVVERIGISRLSKMLSGLSPKTIRSSLHTLESIGLIVSYQVGPYETIHVQPIGNTHEHLFHKVEKAQLKERKPEEALQEVQFRNEELKLIYRSCRYEGFPIDLSKQVTVVAGLAHVDSVSFDGYSQMVAIEHAKNRIAGTVTIDHHGYLLLYKLEQIREEQIRNEERMFATVVADKKGNREAEPDRASPAITRGPNSPTSPNQENRADDCAELVAKQAQKPTPPTSGYLLKIAAEVKKTNEFLRKQFGRNPTVEDFGAAIADRRMRQWVNWSRVSPYYLLASSTWTTAAAGRDEKDLIGCSLDVERSNFPAEELERLAKLIAAEKTAENAGAANGESARSIPIESGPQRNDWFLDELAKL